MAKVAADKVRGIVTALPGDTDLLHVAPIVLYARGNTRGRTNLTTITTYRR
jgi:hypothetical protein